MKLLTSSSAYLGLDDDNMITSQICGCVLNLFYLFSLSLYKAAGVRFSRITTVSRWSFSLIKMAGFMIVETSEHVMKA